MSALRLLCATAAACTVLGACASASPQWDASFGDAARRLRAQQVIDADAPSRADPGLAADGKAVAGAQKAYAESFGYAVKEPRVVPLTLAPTAGK